jgi:hypothetical protein
MATSAGTVRAWDGLGEIVVDGETYLGVHGLHNISQISNTAKIQSHEYQFTLAGVPGPGFANVSVRNRPASLFAFWVAEDGSTVESEKITLLEGFGDFITESRSASGYSATVTIRSVINDWASPPASFYTPQDQARLFAGDNGFDLVRDLESATVTGWSKDAPVVPVRFEYRSATGLFASDDSARLVVIISSQECIRLVGGEIRSEFSNTSGATVTEATTGGQLIVSNGYLATAAGACLLNASDRVQTPGGLTTSPTTRPVPAIASVGTVTTTRAEYVVAGNSRITMGVADDINGQRIMCGQYGSAQFFTSGADGIKNNITGLFYKATGTSRRLVRSTTNDRLQVDGVDVRISSTGYVLTQDGLQISLDGDGGDATLRLVLP